MGWVRIQYVTPTEIRVVEYGEVPDCEKIESQQFDQTDDRRNPDGIATGSYEPEDWWA